MKLRSTLGAFALGFVLAPIGQAQTPAAATSAPDASHPGKAVYDKACATCHAAPTDGRTPTFASLTQMPAPQLAATLVEGGKMAPMAAGLSADEKAQVVAYLTSGQKQAASDWSEAMACAADKRAVNVSATAAFAGFGGADLSSKRMLTAKQAGISLAQMQNLDVAWTIAIPQAQGGTGVVTLGDTAFVNAGGKLLALDAGSGCIKWSYTAASRNTPTLADINGKKALVMAAGRGEVHAIDASNGQLLWKADGRPASGRLGIGIRGGVTVYKDKVFVPISDSGIGGNGPNGECCEGHGVVVALSAKDGKRLWEYHTMKDAEYTGEVNPAGAKLKGPSGAPIWSVPTIDVKRNRVLVSTGENTSHPGTDTSDAIIALDIDTGKVAWKFQAMEQDVWNMQCRGTKETSGVNCPWNHPKDTGVGRDFDFGAAPVLVTAGNRDIVLAGQKSGHVWALDATNGKVLWQQQVGKGTALGGVHWGITTDGVRVFAPINDPFPGEAPPKPGMFAFDIQTGNPVWAYDAKPDCDGPRGKLAVNCKDKYGFSAAPIVIDGAVIGGTLDGKLFVFDGATGKTIRSFDFIGPQKTTNGIEGKGGSIDSHAISAGAGTIFVSAGYGSFNQTPGNIIVALRPKK